MNDNGSFVTSDSGIVVWKSPKVHPLLSKTNINHPDFVRKTGEVFTRGRVRGLSRICSENSEDARTWLTFSPLLEDATLKVGNLKNLLIRSFPGAIEPETLQHLRQATLFFWHGKKTPNMVLAPPSYLPFKQGLTEVDLIVTLESRIVVFIEAKYKSDVTPGVKNAPLWDQVIRNVDVGSWFALEHHFDRFYFILLQYGDHPSNAESVLLNYRDKPEVVKEALEHRKDLNDRQIEVLARSMAFARQSDPMERLLQMLTR